MTGGGTLAQVVQRTWDSGGVGAFWKGNMVRREGGGTLAPVWLYIHV